MTIIEEIRADVTGAALLADWLGSGGKPVSQIVAEHRAHICTHGDGGYPCGKNVAPNWWDKVKHAIADAIKAELEVKNKLSLKVSSEESVNICSCCGCCLRLAVWVPIERLKEHTTQKQLDCMPVWCWKRREILAS